MIDRRDEAMSFMVRALAILDCHEPTPAACHLQNAIDLLRIEGVVARPRARGAAAPLRHDA